MYTMDFTKSPDNDDFVFESHGVRIFIDKESSKHLAGVSIDYVETIQSSGFKFENPNAKASCGCGKSFS
jgi:iron-sulfur cluster assembly accessory protein